MSGQLGVGPGSMRSIPLPLGDGTLGGRLVSMSLLQADTGSAVRVGCINQCHSVVRVQ